jgi:hypothetical protein
VSKMPIFSSDGETNYVPVLVSYRFVRYKFSPWREEAIMVHAATSREILSEANQRLKAQRFHNYEIVSYLPRNGMELF